MEPDKSDNSKPVVRNGTAIALILAITLAAISGVVVILLAIAISFDKVSFSDAKDIFSLILVTMGTLTGSALGFYFGALSLNKPDNF
jgi:hypothetical protein